MPYYDTPYDKHSRKVNSAMKASRPSTKIKLMIDAANFYKKIQA